MCVRIEKQSVEMEQRLREAEDFTNSNWKRKKDTAEKGIAKGVVPKKARRQTEQERR